MFNTFMDQVIAAQVAQSFEAQKVGGRLKVLEPAQLPLEPVNTNRLIIMSIAALGALCLGLMLVFVVEHHDTTIRDGSELPMPIRDRLIGSMPLIRDRLRAERNNRRSGGGRPVTVFDYYRDEAASSFEFRRLALELAGPKGQLPKTLMVTSSERGEGKTTTSSLLALTIARHRKVRTLLLDLDMRKPSAHRQLGIPRHSPGAAEALVERRLSQELVQPTQEPSLFILPAGSFKSLSPETLTPESVRWLLDELLQWYDQIVIDAPPNLAVPDPLVIGKAVDAVLFVVKSGKTSQRVFARGYDLQVRARENVAGVFINNIRNTMPHYYSYDYYGYTADETPKAPSKPKIEKPRPKLVREDRA
jgi:capsular exopolysaccharide synthesis family protein